MNNRNSDNQIGGLTEGERNIIAGNLGYGIFINAGDDNSVYGNYIGVGADGKTLLGNSYDGIAIYSGSRNTIGSHPNGFNVIGNNRTGVKIESYSLPAEGNDLRGNYIGQSSDGQHVLPNTDGIILLGTAKGNELHWNSIKNNLNTGITIMGTAHETKLYRNAIYNNGGLGIDLGGDGVTANDYQDTDGGPNLRQNYPILTDAFLNADGKIKVTGSINSTPNTNLKIRFFASANCNDTYSSGFNYGEGNSLVEGIEFLTDNNGDYAFSVALGSAETAGPYVSAYAVDPNNNTSEFCECVLISNWPAMHNGTNGPVYAIAVDSSNGEVYIGGDFTLAGGNPVSNLARWTGSGWVDVGAGVDSTVFALDIDSQGNLYVGGAFTQAGGGISTRRIAQWDGSQWSSVGSGMDGTVRSIVVDEYNRAYIGGDFHWVEYTLPTGGIVRWNGATWSTFGNQFNGVRSIALSPNGALYASGYIDIPGGSNNNENIAHWNGSNWESLNGAELFSGPANQLVFDSQGILYAGGEFLLITGQAYNFVARYNPITKQWSVLDNSLDDYVHDLAIDGSDRLFIGGKFDDHFDGLAQWDGQAISSLGTGVKLSGPSFVHALAVDGNYLYVGGNFHFINTAPANYIARVYIPYSNLRQTQFEAITELPDNTCVLPAYPNPTNSSVRIPIVLQKSSSININIYNSYGQLALSQTKVQLPQGKSEIILSSWQLEKLTRGIYFYTIYIDNEKHNGKFIISRD